MSRFICIDPDDLEEISASVSVKEDEIEKALSDYSWFLTGITYVGFGSEDNSDTKASIIAINDKENTISSDLSCVEEMIQNIINKIKTDIIDVEDEKAKTI